MSKTGVFASLFHMLTTLFNMITKTAKVLEVGVQMAHSTAEIAQEEQTIELVIRRKDMRKRLVDQHVMQSAKREQVIQDYANTSPEHRKLVDTLRTNVEAEIDKALNNNQSQD